MININADLGEGINNEAQIMPFIHSCNIACGGHFGDVQSIETTMLLAKANNVKIGAHPSYNDPVNFGRKVLNISPAQLTKDLITQLGTFQSVAKKLDTQINHIKPHGALYNHAAKHKPTAQALLNAIRESKINVKIYAPPRSIFATLANDDYEIIYEAFIDRRYEPDLSLVPRSKPNAIIHDKILAWQQLKEMLSNQRVKAIDGEWQSLDAQTFCIHGDHENSLSILQYIHLQLTLLLDGI